MAALILSFTCFFAAGLCRGIFECIITFDTVRTHWGNYWSFKSFKLGKDRNADGKISYFEKTFPNDGGHRIKLAELWLYAIGSTLMAISFLLWVKPTVKYLFVYAIAATAMQWLVVSTGFLLSFNKYKKKPKKQNYHGL